MNIIENNGNGKMNIIENSGRSILLILNPPIDKVYVIYTVF